MKKIIYDYDYIFKDNNNNTENIIFCHGFNASINVFNIFKNYWTKSNYYALQFPGNNNVKPIKDHEISVLQFAKLVVEFVKNNNLKNITLIGHSMGGGTISLAYQLAPELFKKLVYVCPMNKASEDVNNNFLHDYFPKTFEEFTTDFLGSLYYDPSFLTKDPKWMRLAKWHFSGNDYNTKELTDLGKTLVSKELHEQIYQAIKTIKIPTLLILGEKDGVVNREACLKYYQDEVKNVITTWIPKTGHMVFEEDWDSFIKILEPFLLNK
ncbi:alpha/beta fold hydrolase [Mycoplasma mycoides]|uniref:alpha/beta fold hydrolase n=1 Tax=Mycoplasma mycoides TaxID=2102 RepID=UPI00223FE243|nr:alpha/beta hydrolase [Mycoplasma mycoides]QVJ95124.1 alpha/beta hydrolase [Mycoplasma mycoides subsp. capri]